MFSLNTSPYSRRVLPTRVILLPYSIELPFLTVITSPVCISEDLAIGIAIAPVTASV